MTSNALAAAVLSVTATQPSNQKLAWGRIRERAEAAIAKLESPLERPPRSQAVDLDPDKAFGVWLDNLFGGGRQEMPFNSIHDEIQAEYKSGRITEPERDAMRKHVEGWLGNPKVHHDAVRWVGNDKGYDAYSCGLWAPTAKPWDVNELYFIHTTLVILEEESE